MKKSLTKMNFKCKIESPSCGKLFHSESEVLEHFKMFHGMKQGINEFPCIKNNSCGKQYLTIKSLKSHVKKFIVQANVYLNNATIVDAPSDLSHNISQTDSFEVIIFLQIRTNILFIIINL